ncbi:hypothetical protein ES705_43974 [subsurface metagenome]
MVKKEDKWIGELVGVFTDPIIVMPGGWGDSLPDWIRPAITQGRLIANMEAARGGEMTGCDAEACAYLFTASLTAPMGSDWTQIYLYIAGKTMTQWKKIEMPKDIKVEEISSYQMGMLNHLKHWIYDIRMKHRKGQARTERVEKKEAVASLQQKFDLGLDS